MKPSTLRGSPFLIIAVLLICSAPKASAGADATLKASPKARIAFVNGDVRLSRGKDRHTDLRQGWEQAQNGARVEQGFALATGNGSAEIELDNGSTVYLAANSLLLFPEFLAWETLTMTQLALPTGTATVWMRPAQGEHIFLETPTDTFEFAGPYTFFLRLDAYLDGTAITGEDVNSQSISGWGVAKLQVARKQTIFVKDGEVLAALNSSASGATRKLPCEDSTPAPGSAGGDAFPCLGKLPNAVIPGDFEALELAQGTLSLGHTNETFPAPPLPGPPARDAWDRFVEARVREKEHVQAAALQAADIPSPVAGLLEMYAHGNFVSCEPYGRCWEPRQQEAAPASTSQTPPPNAQSATSSAPTTAFQPRRVEWMETEWVACGASTATPFSDVARTPEELEKLLRLKAASESQQAMNAGFVRSWRRRLCYENAWVPYQRHYAMVLHPVPCKPGEKCKPVHRPRPVVVRVAGKVGVLPPRPDDVKGEPSHNLRNGIILAPAKPGGQVQTIAWEPSQKLESLDKIADEFEREFPARALPAAAPEIRAHLMPGPVSGSALSAASHGDTQIRYDIKAQKFLMPAAAGAGGAKAKEVAVGGIASSGRVASFASAESGSRYASGFGHSSAASSYSGGGNSGSHYSSSGSASSGSSGASSSRGSGGGGGGFSSAGSSSSASSSSSSSSSSSGSSGGGHPH